MWIHVQAVTRLVFIFGLALPALSETYADDALSAQVDAMFATYDRADSAGCAVGIVSHGELIYSNGFGSANLDHEVANTPQTIFEIGSFANRSRVPVWQSCWTRGKSHRTTTFAVTCRRCTNSIRPSGFAT
ncbi:MAG TPA: hypothetical protein EYQ63_11545 [Fuerstia sp.]|nr:hypothetical protein [Fuerstiella sp.]